MAEPPELFPRGSRKTADDIKSKHTPKRDKAMFSEPSTVQASVPKFVELLKHKTLSVGTKLWGVVHDVSKRDLTISLPHGLRGFVTFSETSDVVSELLEAEGAKSDSDSDAEDTALVSTKSKYAASNLPSLSDLFNKGQLVQCVVDKLGSEKGSSKRNSSNKRIDLSLRLSKVLHGLDSVSLQADTMYSACVRSVEDHGFILSFGVPGVSGFLMNADTKPGLDSHGKPFLPGTLLS
eukprot:CAMPEP_0196596010 /NCGR_PEP_ID=MMETSP1081-20130531/83629_1 /TAXON_ID=36882 /ORGANISM="Pyramimonas amylifera, Strain CCMP720" /LENGTH=235 /DNA_ID=CAMNT_0041920817 /DNA_START=52 /DNA_END=756 /DNA_ORIENTATION=+